MWAASISELLRLARQTSLFLQEGCLHVAGWPCGGHRTGHAAQADLLQNSRSLSGKQMRSLLLPGCRTAGRGLVPAEGVLQLQLFSMSHSGANGTTRQPDSIGSLQVGLQAKQLAGRC